MRHSSRMAGLAGLAALARCWPVVRNSAGRQVPCAHWCQRRHRWAAPASPGAQMGRGQERARRGVRVARVRAGAHGACEVHRRQAVQLFDAQRLSLEVSGRSRAAALPLTGHSIGQEQGLQVAQENQIRRAWWAHMSHVALNQAACPALAGPGRWR